MSSSDPPSGAHIFSKMAEKKKKKNNPAKGSINNNQRGPSPRAQMQMPPWRKQQIGNRYPNPQGGYPRYPNNQAGYYALPNPHVGYYAIPNHQVGYNIPRNPQVGYNRFGSNPRSMRPPNSNNHVRNTHPTDGNTYITLTQEQFDQLTCSDKNTNYKKKEERGTTVNSTDVLGDVQEAEICVFSLSKTCKFDNCRKLHAKCPLHWQFKVSEKWYNFRDFHSKELEAAYQNPEKDRVKLSKINPQRLNESHVEIANLLTTDELTADFVAKTVETDSIRYKIRRLSTYSSAKTSNKMATVWEWYFEDELGKWIKYGQVNSLNKVNCVPNITSQDIEEKYAKDKVLTFKFSSPAGHSYILDFNKETQMNDETQVTRKVKRRPHFTPPTCSMSLTDMPKQWVKMKPERISEQINLDENDKEYKEVAQLVNKSLSVKTFVSIKRNQNPGLWRSFVNGKQKMMLKNKLSESDLNEMKLFHGTSAANIGSILERNLDWRLHGLSVGQRFGRGTYFAKQASYSDHYAQVDNQLSKHILVCRVLVGSYTVGRSTMVTPPVNPLNQTMYDSTVNDEKNPSIYVKYDSQEYYPEYLVTYRN